MRARIYRWFRNLGISIGSSIRENVSTIGGAFCGLFVVSIVICSVVMFLRGDYRDSTGPVGIAADISGASFAIAVVLLSLGRVSMVIARIFRDRRVDEARQAERELAIRADRERLPNESLRDAMERLRESQRS